MTDKGTLAGTLIDILSPTKITCPDCQKIVIGEIPFQRHQEICRIPMTKFKGKTKKPPVIPTKELKNCLKNTIL